MSTGYGAMTVNTNSTNRPNIAFTPREPKTSRASLTARRDISTSRALKDDGLTDFNLADIGQLRVFSSLIA